MRKKIVIGNWKMNMTPSQAQDLLKMLVPKCKSEDVDVVFCPPYVDLYTALKETEGTNICIGAQNVHFEEKGAYTGEISPSMLEDMGIKYVIIGHCERRKYFAESDEDVNKKAKKLLEHKIVPVICCGETLEQREANITLEVIKKQIKIALLGIEENLVENVIIAYEPIWAIGTGKVATQEQAQEVCLAIRETVREVYNEKVAQNIRILYGGSVNKDNVASLFSQPDIDGGLVGGASLKEEFEVIVNLGR